MAPGAAVQGPARLRTGLEQRVEAAGNGQVYFFGGDRIVTLRPAMIDALIELEAGSFAGRGPA